VSADTALLFEALTGWDAQIWLSLQAKWDLSPSRITVANAAMTSFNATQ
jgi:plasmid maintenance system antidote protein VapI